MSVQHSRPTARRLAALTAVTLIGGTFGPGALAGTASAASATSSAARAGGLSASSDGTAQISSSALSVDVARDFPRIIRYTDRHSGASLGGSTSPVHTVVLNGKKYRTRVHTRRVSGSTAHYALSFPALPGVRIQATLSVRGRTVAFRVRDIQDNDSFRVGTLDIPGHDLVSVSSRQRGASTAFTRGKTDSTKNADEIHRVTSDRKPDGEPVGSTYALVNTDTLAAGVQSNAMYDKPKGETDQDMAQYRHQARKDADGSVRVGVWSGQWTYRADTAKTSDTEPLPYAKVTISRDRNHDGKVTWQDGAIGLREASPKPPGADETRNRVITHIPFNFASQASHPFLRTLDDVKRISLATDGLGQNAILKGYASEGHDSAHPDYGGHYNTRAGGLRGLNRLLKAGKKWNATFGVHVNSTEAYPEAHAFNEKLVDTDEKGWDWLDQSFAIDQRRDLVSGDIQRRFRQLRRETDANLSFLYMDVYRSYGWKAQRLQRELAKQGWQVGTEWADHMQQNSLWSHWSNDRDYGGKDNKGLNSTIIRFLQNQDRDVFNDHPILGASAIEEFEGWTGETDWNAFYDNVFQQNLPTKFLQHYAIEKWTDHTVRFDRGVRGTDAHGKREVWQGDAKVIDGDSYLLPWGKGKHGTDHPNRLYHYNPSGGASTWKLPRTFRNAHELTVYRLTGQGRKAVDTVTPKDDTVTVHARAGQPYVLYPDHAPEQTDPAWGEGTKLTDPGFHAGNLRAWHPSGGATVHTSGKGAQVATLPGEKKSGISQRVSGLVPGREYSASVWVEVEPGQTRRTRVQVSGSGGLRESTHVDRSTARNQVDADEKHGTYFQRVKVPFTAPSDGRVQLGVAAAAGSARVRLDDVRVVASQQAPGNGQKHVVAAEDFEHTDQGWYPFVKGDAGGSTDPRTHLAEKHAPYTQRGWNGKLVDDVLGGRWSLKSHDENKGLVYRSTPDSIRLKKGHRYRVAFDYANGRSGAYQWVTGADTVSGGKPTSVERRRTDIPKNRKGGHFTQKVTAGCADTWIGLRRTAKKSDPQSDFVLDNLKVIDLGATDKPADCSPADGAEQDK